MKNFILSVLLILGVFHLVNAQIFKQNFESSTVVTDYASTSNPTSGQFDALTTTAATSPPVTVTIENGALRFNRTGTGSIFAYRNFTFPTNPTFVQLKMDFEASGNVIGTQIPIFNVFIGSAFSSASSGMNSAYASRFGILAQATAGNFKIGTVDNIGGAPESGVFSGKQTITFIVNNSGTDQNYTAPNGTTEMVTNGKMDVWIGTTRGINEFSLKNTTGSLADISGFKIQATSASGSGIYDFDNIEFRDLITDIVPPPVIDLPDTPPAYLTLKHPYIWASYPERQNIVNNIEQYTWGSSMYNQLKARVDANKNTHKTNPSAILSTIPAIPGVKTDRSLHNDILTSASEAAILYYLTDDPDYAQYASDILSHYTDRLSLLPSRAYAKGSGLLFSDWWLESRALYPKIAIIYDFVYNYANNPANTVFDIATSSRRAFNNAKAQTTVQTLSFVTMKSIDSSTSNHSVLAGNGALFNLLMIDADATRNTYFNYFYDDPSNFPFDEYKWTLANFTTQNIWDETFDYSKYSHELVLQTLNVIDRYKPELNIITNNKRILDGFPFYENLYYPSGEIMRFGDTNDEVDLLYGYQRMLKIATRKNMTAEIATTKQILKFEYDKRGGNKPKIETENLEWTNPLQLLWGVNVEDTVTPTPPILKATVPVQHAGLVIQRNYNTTDVKTNGLMYYSGGSGYVHAHSTGIDLELYGKGQVLGAMSGSGVYNSSEHENYRVRLASHNTVIANGSGLRGGTSWVGRMSKVNLTSSEPKPNVNPISTNYSFSTQSIDDTYNDCLQQRTNSIVRTSPTTGYYYDIARSKGKTTNNFHDYIYHNIGDVVNLKYTNNTSLPLSTSTKYDTDVAVTDNVTGWKFFENIMSSTPTPQAVNAKFSLNTVNKFMNVLIPDGISREYATALSPYTKGALNGYDAKKTPLITMRKFGEAWDQPFIAIFEPSDNVQGTVKSATTIFDNNKAVGARVVSEVNGQQIIDIILSNDSDNVAINLPQYNISFTGRFAIVRTEVKNGTTDVSLYIGRGQQLVFIDKTLNGDGDGKAYLEYNLNYALSTSNFSISAENLVVFPNPTNGIFEIKNLPLSINTIKLGLYSMDSKLIETKTYNVNNGAVILDISSKDKGIYFVKGDSTHPFFVKIIKN